MSTLQELVRYCNEEQHLGALLLIGELGCGKTFLIDQDLTEALSATHYIVRVSLLGVDSVAALNDAVRKRWLMTCTPFLGKLGQERAKMKQYNGLFVAMNRILSSIHPLQGNIASALITVDPLEYIPLQPVVEDLHNRGEKKKVVLVFDDLSRSKMDPSQIIGAINVYRENMGFTTIVIAEESTLKTITKNNASYYRMIKEKTFSRTVRYVPDNRAIIHTILTGFDWSSQEYKDFLFESEQILCDIFASDASKQQRGIAKCHNFRSLICALRDFSQLHAFLVEHQVPDIDRFFYAFVAYTLVSRSGIMKDGQLCFDVQNEDFKQLYPSYDPDMLPACIRLWIEEGFWEEDMFLKHFSDQAGSP